MYDMSIIVPIHGRIDLFKETLQSLEAQNYDNFEVIFTDDTQHENEREEIKKLISNFPKPYRYVFTTPNLGQAGNTNQGFREASGRYVRVLHSDDLLHPETIKFEVKTFDKFQDQVDFMFHKNNNFFNSKKIEFNANHVEHTLQDSHTLFTQMLPYYTAIPSAMVMKRDFIIKHNLHLTDKYSYICDMELFCNMLIKSHEDNKKILEISAGYIYWRVHEDSVSGRGMITHYNETSGLLHDIYACIFKMNIINMNEYHSFLFAKLHDKKIHALLWEITGRGAPISIKQILKNLIMTRNLWRHNIILSVKYFVKYFHQKLKC